MVKNIVNNEKENPDDLIKEMDYGFSELSEKQMNRIENMI